MNNKNTMKNIIINIININNKYQEIKKIKGEEFNIFSILKLERNEVKTHSNFIYELLNSQGSHNQGNLFLKLFIEQVLKLSDYGDVKKTKVYQEYLTTKNRRIDFVIETEKYQIGIEMKIDAKDQDNQLLDYMTELKLSNKEAKLYYLTLTGYKASEVSIGDDKLDYMLLSFESNIYDWIMVCIEKSATIALLREGLIHYKNLISIITNKISKPMEKDMQELVKTPKEIEAVQSLLNEYPRIWAKKEIDFLNKLNEKLENFYIDKNFEIINEYDTLTDGNVNEYDNIIANIMKKNLSGFALQMKHESGYFTKLYIEIAEGTLFLSIAFFDKKEEQIKLNENMDKICKTLNFNSKNINYRYKKAEENIIFFSKNQTVLTYDLFDTDKFNSYVESFAREIETKITYIKTNEDDVLKALSS